MIKLFRGSQEVTYFLRKSFAEYIRDIHHCSEPNDLKNMDISPIFCIKTLKITAKLRLFGYNDRISFRSAVRHYKSRGYYSNAEIGFFRTPNCATRVLD